MNPHKRRTATALCGLLLASPVLLAGTAQPSAAFPIGGCVSPGTSGPNQTVLNDAGTGTVTMAPVQVDAYYEKYASADDKYTWEVYKGAAGDSSTTTAEMDALTQASLDNAVDGEAPSSADQTTNFASLPAPTNVKIQASVLTTPLRLQVASYGADGAPRCSGDLEVMRDGTIQSELDGGLMILPGDSETTAEATPTAVSSPWSYYVHAAFIPAASVYATPLCGYFKGDNRSFATTGSSRTRISIKGDWVNKRIITQKLVNATHRTSPSPATKTASSAGIKFVGGSASTSYFRIEAAHSVGNPLCRSRWPDPVQRHRADVEDRRCDCVQQGHPGTEPRNVRVQNKQHLLHRSKTHR